MKIKIAKLLGFCFIVLSILLVSYLCFQNYNSAKEEPKRATLVINLINGGDNYRQCKAVYSDRA